MWVISQVHDIFQIELSHRKFASIIEKNHIFILVFTVTFPSIRTPPASLGRCSIKTCQNKST